MKDNADTSSVKSFIKKVIVADVGIFILASLISLSQNFSIGISLFVLGVVIGGTGAYLGEPSRFAGRYERNNILSECQPNKVLSNRITSFIANTVPFYSFENVMMFSGWIAIIISIPFLFVIMFPN